MVFHNFIYQLDVSFKRADNTSFTIGRSSGFWLVQNKASLSSSSALASCSLEIFEVSNGSRTSRSESDPFARAFSTSWCKLIGSPFSSMSPVGLCLVINSITITPKLNTSTLVVIFLMYANSADIRFKHMSTRESIWHYNFQKKGSHSPCIPEPRPLISVYVKTWCIAKPSTSKEALVNNLQYACNNINAMDCKAIQEGDPCSKPNDLLLYASFAMNAYYQARGRHYWNCDFGNSGLISLTDPSYGNCTYEGGETAMDDSNSGNWCVASPSASDDQLQANIEFACGKVDCSIIRSGDACFEPNTVKNRASIAVNLYYHQTGQSDTSCDFNGSGNIVRTDPSIFIVKIVFSTIITTMCGHDLDLIVYACTGYGDCKFKGS